MIIINLRHDIFAMYLWSTIYKAKMHSFASTADKLHCYHGSEELEGAVVQSSIATYVEITSSPIVAVIFSGGVSEITIGIGQNLTLDPEALSQDPDDPHMKRVSVSVSIVPKT